MWTFKSAIFIRLKNAAYILMYIYVCVFVICTKLVLFMLTSIYKGKEIK